jgi:IS605 OrfB family transposase
MITQATIRLKVPSSNSLIDTMFEFSKATQHAYDYAVKHRVNSWTTLHQMLYGNIRSFSKLPSQLCCKAIKFALETKKRHRNRKVNFSKQLTIQYDKRSYSFDFSGKCSLSTIKGRLKLNLDIPQYYLETYKDWDVRSATLSKLGKDLFLNVVVAKEVNPSSFIPKENKIVGIDLGINNLATTSEKQFFRGVRTHIARFQRLRSQLQSKGTSSARKHMKRLRGRQRRFMRSVNHEISKSIISQLNAGDVVVMEDLRGIRRKRRGKALNRLLSNWAFAQLKGFIEYKAMRAGVMFMIVPPHYSSKTCSRCNEILSTRPKNAGFFKCLNCGYSCNADLNASFNLKGRTDALRNVLGLSVDQPIVAGNYCFPSDKPTTLVVGS